jgi:signal transduction histidine kinase
VVTPSSPRNLEPGVLQIFQWSVRLLFLSLVPFFIGVVVKRTERFGLDYNIVMGTLFTFVLSVYLANPRFVAWAGERKHLVYGVIALSVAPSLLEFLGNAVYLQDGGDLSGQLANPSGLYFWLLSPLLMVSTLYGSRGVIIFTFGTTLWSIGLAVVSREWWGTPITSATVNGGVRFLIYSLIGVIAARIIGIQRKLRTELAEKNAQVAEYASRMEELSITQERNRMARELHDTLAHTLSAIEVQLKVIDMLIDRDLEKVRELVQETHELTRSGLGEARRALHDLRTSAIEEFGLTLAIKRLAERAEQRTGAKLNLSLVNHLPSLSNAAQHQLYRIIEEALNNMVRHANASEFSVGLCVQGHTIELRIEDNGVGFDPAAQTQAHFGIQGMCERATLIDAAFTLKSAPKSGTSIVVRLENAT